MDNQNRKANRAIKNGVIFLDFLFLNVLYACFMLLFSGGTPEWDKALFTAVVMNISMAGAELFFSTIIHFRRPTFDMIFRQVTYLVVMQRIVEFVLAKVFLSRGTYTLGGIVTFIAFSVSLYLLIMGTRYLERWAVKRYRSVGRDRSEVLFIGSNAALAPVYEFLTEDKTLGYHVKGYFSDEAMDRCPDGLIKLGSLKDVEALLASKSDGNPIAGEIYYCLPEKDNRLLRKVIKYCNAHVVRFYYIPVVTQMFDNVRFRISNVGDTVVFTNHYEPLLLPGNKAVKRTFDILMSGCVLFVLLPFIPIIALIIKMQSPGPVFFSQDRTGLDGHTFKCYKFRSMHVNAQADELQATKDDPRKFPFGDFMRKTNIDELPQFFNVFIGNMSIVGPRPHMLKHTDMYKDLISTYMVRHFVKPGITGWAQVTGFRGETKELWQMEGRVRRDIWYIENWSLVLDIRIIMKTIYQTIRHNDEHAF